MIDLIEDVVIRFLDRRNLLCKSKRQTSLVLSAVTAFLLSASGVVGVFLMSYAFKFEWKTSLGLCLLVIIIASWSEVLKIKSENEMRLRELGEERPTSPSLEPRLLMMFRWFLPRRCRDDINLLINDIRADAYEMHALGEHWSTIWAVKTWHSLWSIGGIIWDGLTKLIQKVWPTYRMIHQIHKAMPPSSDDTSDENPD